MKPSCSSINLDGHNQTHHYVLVKGIRSTNTVQQLISKINKDSFRYIVNCFADKRAVKIEFVSKQKAKRFVYFAVNSDEIKKINAQRRSKQQSLISVKLLSAS